MKYDELTGFKCAVAVAVACLEDERPKGESIQPEAAAQYVSDVLEVCCLRFRSKPRSNP